MAVSANRLELLQIADAVAREKSIDKEIVLEAMADAIQKAARSRYGLETNIRADINSKTGEIKLAPEWRRYRIDFEEGDEAIMCHLDYGSMLQAFEQQSRRLGLVTRYIELPLHPKSDEE